MSRADDIERAVTAFNRAMGGLRTPWADTLRSAARAYAALLRRIETGELRDKVARLASVGSFDALEAFDRAEMLEIADRIIALFRNRREALDRMVEIADESQMYDLTAEPKRTR